jgi:N-acetylglucosaminyldiphosphoundecaprenol N-acetyl-beta-D-mannosaminyltransferase
MEGARAMGEKTEVLGIGFDAVSTDDAAELIFCASRLRNDRPYIVFTPNASISMTCRKAPDLLSLVNSASLVLPDGVGVIGAAKRQGTPLPERVAGIDTAEAVMEKLAAEGGSVYLVGGEQGISERAARSLCEKYKGLMVFGACDGFFKDEDALVKEISALSPDLLLVGMGFPKQELFISHNKEKLSVGAAIGVGGAIDVWAGKVRRAPNAFIKLHVEWLWRMLCQPKRFWGMWRLFYYRILTRRRFLR